ncbi:MAG TPA: hypothetical protein VEQ61_08235, partial [Thermoleophilaceae bacterium]|nr:hypothetical protein [Thermoleophilaceae bacterium]
CVLGLLPIAFTDGGGALEVLTPDGRVVAGVEQLAATLRGLAGSPELSPEARQARSAWARRAFPIEATARGYDAVYRNVVGKAQER